MTAVEPERKRGEPGPDRSSLEAPVQSSLDPQQRLKHTPNRYRTLSPSPPITGLLRSRPPPGLLPLSGSDPDSAATMSLANDFVQLSKEAGRRNADVRDSADKAAQAIKTNQAQAFADLAVGTSRFGSSLAPPH